MTSADAARRCPSCGARMAHSQQWCALCWADARPAPAPEQARVREVAAAPEVAATRRATAPELGPPQVEPPLPTRRSIRRQAAAARPTAALLLPGASASPVPGPPEPQLPARGTDVPPPVPAPFPADRPRWATAADVLRTPAGRVVAGLVGVVAASLAGTAVLGLVGSFL